ncbi:MAG: sugar ABC transporter ATP-binding protein [Chloroflexi bacterium]|nr:sugar ABC transporter ATP-binding protein [Chloroflexota bacterium]
MSENLAAIIQLEKITKRFPGVLALDQVTLSVYPGEIHAVIGENGAGKSTLMNILAGELQPDEGKIYFNGSVTLIPNPVVSRRLGISVVFQELALCPNLSVADNISLWRMSEQSPISFLDRKLYDSTANETLTSLGLKNMNLSQPAGQLSVAKQQMVEIARAISTRARVLILDEPNSALTQEESEHLFDVIRRLRDDGVAIIYISHHLQEVLDIADRITVLRDGRVVDTLSVDGATITTLIASMVGRNITAAPRDFERKAFGDVAFDAVNLSSSGTFTDISFQVHSGEVVGIAGLPDSYKDELVEAMFGLGKLERGEIYLKGKPTRIHNPTDAIQYGMYLIPADRRGAGALLMMTLEENIVASSLNAVSRAGFLHGRESQILAQKYFDRLDIRATGVSQVMANLSGGNQQKVILGRGLATEPAVLVLHEPTRGIDVGAKAEIYKILQNLAGQGAAVVIVSSELPELISQCDRILVMHAGRISGVFTHGDATEEGILGCAMGHAEHLA